MHEALSLHANFCERYTKVRDHAYAVESTTIQYILLCTLQCIVCCLYYLIHPVVTPTSPQVLALRKQLVITMQSATSADISNFETRSVAKDVYRLNRLAHMLGQNFKDEHSAGTRLWCQMIVVQVANVPVQPLLITS